MAYTIFDVYNRTNYYINDQQGSYQSPEEIMDMIDAAQLEVYSDYQSRKGTSELIDSALVSFKRKYTYTTLDTPSGILTFAPDYFDLIDIYATPTINGAVRNRPLDFPNEDERANRMDSQLIPMTVNDPFGEMLGRFQGVMQIQLYPQIAQSGVATYYRRPVAPVMGYAIISGRIIVYDPGSSTQLEWSDKDINTIIVRALTGVGINISAEDVQMWADKKAAQNAAGTLKT